ncbi:hypothetical protein WJ970_10945 [Achromobacter xylosoxidans]
MGLYQGGELRVEQGARLLTREANVGYAVSTPGESDRVTISGADSEWDAGANAIVLGSYGGNGELAVLNQSRVKAGAIMVGGDSANPGSDGTGVLRIGAGAVIETGQVATLAAGTGSVIADGGLLRLTGDQPGLFAGFKAGDIKLEANGLTIDINRPYSATAVAGLSGAGAYQNRHGHVDTGRAKQLSRTDHRRRRRAAGGRQRQFRRQRQLSHQ